MTKEYIINLIKTDKEMLSNRFGVEKIGLFGSYVKGTATEESDIDFYVVFKKKTLDNMTGLWLYLEKLFGKKVDLMHEHPKLRRGFKVQIEQEIEYA